MFDHALRVSNISSNITAIEAVLIGGDIILSNDELAAIKHNIGGTKKAYLVNDTRALQSGDVFAAVIGTALDGREYIEHALKAGCTLVFVETPLPEEHGNLTWFDGAENTRVPCIAYYQLNIRLFNVAKAFYHMPQDKLNVIGITGTNGKTSTSQIIANLLDSCQKDCAVIGTNGAGKLSNLTPINNTTPGATELHQLLSTFVDNDYSDVAMEVSSHALSQKRVSADLFNIAVFTNLTRDHLDYHETMDNYAAAKKQIFSGSAKQVAILNGDDACAQRWLTDWPSQQPVIVYGVADTINTHALFVQAKNIRNHTAGVQFTLSTHEGDCEINSQLLGRFNVDNLLAAIAVLLVYKIGLDAISDAISALTPIIGRMESFSVSGKVTGVVDYAHTPDALESALAACRLHCEGNLWVVFGCGGDRDKGKRALMAKIAEKHADKIILTNDNPRSELPENIIEDIKLGLSESAAFTTILDRETAVLTALTNADNNDVVLCAGKGHEDYIIFGHGKHHYDERATVRSFYRFEAAL